MDGIYFMEINKMSINHDQIMSAVFECDQNRQLNLTCDHVYVLVVYCMCL